MTASVGAGDVAACSRRTAVAQPPTSLRTSARSPTGFVFERRTVTTMSSLAARSTSAQRRADLDVDIETISGTELLQSLKEFEANVQLRQTEVAGAKKEADQANKALRRRDNHWRIKLGETVLAHANGDGDFRQRLDQIFEKRIAEHHRALLDRWRNRTAPRTTPPPAASAHPAPLTTPPPAASAHRGWKPKKLPNGKWGAAFPNPAGKALPDPLVGALILVQTRKGGEWTTTVTEVIEQDDTNLLVVRTEGRQDTAASHGTPPGESSDAAAEKPAG